MQCQKLRIKIVRTRNVGGNDQRRNQKVVEEAPSPLLDSKSRKLMGEQAVVARGKIFAVARLMDGADIIVKSMF